MSVDAESDCRRRRRLSAVMLIGFVGLALGGAPPAIALDTLPVSQVIEAIKSEIAIARLDRDREDARFKITTVEVDLTAIAKTDVGAGVRIEVPVVEQMVGGGLKGETALTNTQRIRLALRPDGAFEEVSGASSLGLAPAIQSVKAALKEAGRPPFAFALETFVFEAEFVIARSVEGGVRFVFLEAGGESGHIAKQRVGIHMIAAD